MWKILNKIPFEIHNGRNSRKLIVESLNQQLMTQLMTHFIKFELVSQDSILLLRLHGRHSWNVQTCFKWKQQFVKVSQIHYVPVLQVNGYHAEKVMDLCYLDMFIF